MKTFIYDTWKKYKGIFVILALLILFSAICKVPVLFCSVLLLWIGMVWFALQDLKNRATYFVFLLAFFLFLLGGETAELYLGYALEFSFQDEINQHTYLCLLLSLIFLQIGFCVATYVQDRLGKKHIDQYAETPICAEIMQKWMLIGVYVTAIPYYLQTLDAGLYTLQNGYLQYYVDYSSRLPGPVETLSELFTMFFFIYLATMPPKKKCRIPMILYFGNGLLSLLTGRRIALGVAVLVLAAYIIIRHKISKEEAWLSKKKIIVILALCPLMVIVLYVQRYIRYGEDVQVGSIVDIIVRFFSQQGTSINTIKFQKQLEGDDLGCTSLYYTLKYLRSNIITRNIINFPIQYYSQRSIHTVYETNCLADYIMYQVNSADYFAGYGLGTSYIAELHHDLGLAGIALGSAVYGVLLSVLYSMKHFSFWKFVVGFMMLEEFVILPRYGADVILRPFFNLTKMGVFFLIIILSYVAKKKKALQSG